MVLHMVMVLMGLAWAMTFSHSMFGMVGMDLACAMSPCFCLFHDGRRHGLLDFHDSFLGLVH